MKADKTTNYSVNQNSIENVTNHKNNEHTSFNGRKVKKESGISYIRQAYNWLKDNIFLPLFNRIISIFTFKSQSTSTSTAFTKEIIKYETYGTTSFRDFTHNAMKEIIKNVSGTKYPPSTLYPMPSVSRLGTDVGAHVEFMKSDPNLEAKPIVIVLHHSLDPNLVLPKTQRLYNEHETNKYNVFDFIYHETVDGLVKNSPVNNNSINELKKLLNKR